MIGVMAEYDICFATMTDKAKLPANLDMLLLKQRLIELVKTVDAQFLGGLILSNERHRQHGKHPLGNFTHLIVRGICRPVP